MESVIEKVDQFLEKSVDSTDFRIEKLPVETIKKIHDFLLSHLEGRRADRFAKHPKISDKISLKSFSSHISPTILGAITGAFLVLDLGSSYPELVSKSKDLQYWITFIGSLLISCLTLSFNVYSLDIWKKGGKLRKFKNILIVYSITFFGSSFFSGLIILSLIGTELMNNISGFGYAKLALLWSSLGMVFGWFLGIFLKGDRFKKE
ncbi:MAG: hypothetical protein KDK54_18965 [Leptospiraceae bacterium]|nr:hypothetical protein [Leptospiraceae bacterium]